MARTQGKSPREPRGPLTSKDLQKIHPTPPVHDWRPRLIHGADDAKEIRRTKRIRLNPKKKKASPAQILRPSMPAHMALSLRPTMLPRRRRPRLFRGDREITPLTIFDPDRRFQYFDLSYPFGCICRVSNLDAATNAPYSMGSGVLIGPRHVLTASHVIDWSIEENPVLIQVHAASGGTFVSSVTLASAVFAYDFVQSASGIENYFASDNDYAVCVLPVALGEQFGWMGARTYNSDWDETAYWASIGYATDFNNAQEPVFQDEFALDEDALDVGGGRLLTSDDCDVVKGQSGSPAFAFWDDGPYVVGVLSGEDSFFSQNNFAGGSDLQSLVAFCRNEFPA